jgi:Uma2 family endonuclease
MIIFTPIFEDTPKDKPAIPKYDGLEMRLDEFLNSEIEDPGFKYEWNNGILEAEHSRKFNEQLLVDRILRKFSQTNVYKEGNSLLPEVECFLKPILSVKKPDVCYLTKDQIQNSTSKTVDQIPQFVIEILSPSNSGLEVERKIQDYFLSGVKLIWTIYPELKMVKIHTSPKQTKICTLGDICDTDGIIPEFQITVNELFD